MAYGGLVFPFRHNWDDGQGSVGVLERWLGLDAVLSRLDGTEQRSQSRTRPRRQLEYRITPLEANARAYLDNWLRVHQGKQCMIGVWTEQQRIVEAISPGADTFVCNTTFRDFDNGGFLMLYADPYKWEVLEIDAVSLGSITTIDNAELSWAKGEGWIIPARLGYVAKSPSFVTIGNSVSNERLLVEFAETEISSNRFDTITPVQYRSLDALQFEWSKGEDEGIHEGKYAVYDGGSSGLVHGLLDLPADALLPFSRLLIDRVKIASFLYFLTRRKGRRVPFWLPTYQKDFPVHSFFAGVAGRVRYMANGFKDYLFGRPGFQDVVLIPISDIFLHPRGEHAYRRITGCDLFAAGIEQLHFNTSAYGGDVANANMLVCYNQFCRLEGNELEFLWETDTSMRVALRLRRLNEDV